MNHEQDQMLVIFGASGDLTERKLIPALFDIFKRKMLPEHFCILGVSRTPYTDDAFREKQRKNLSDDVRENSENVPVNSFLELLHYQPVETHQSADYSRLSDRIRQLRQEKNIPDKIIFYLATPPLLYAEIPHYLKDNGLDTPVEPDGWRRIVVEKPFGTDLASAKSLNAELNAIFPENNIFRIDHYLGKETVQNILVLRFSNAIFESLWNGEYIDSVEIRAYEQLGVEARGKYYDGAGALRDMIQSHLMELMAFTAMEEPSVFDPEPMRDEIAKVFHSLRQFTPENIDRYAMRGQYKGYRDEPDISPDSATETWVGLKCYIDNERWQGVPFYLYTGKKMSRKISEIIINFKSSRHILFMGQCDGGSCNQLVIRIQPDEGISLGFGLKMPGGGFRVKRVDMDFFYKSLSDISIPDAYVRLLLDAMMGDSTLYPRSDALEASWQFVDPIINRWKEKKDEGLVPYDQQTDGPPEQYQLLT